MKGSKLKPEIVSDLSVRILAPEKTILLPGEVGATIEWVVSDTKTGQISQHQPPKRAESFTKAFFQLLYMQMAHLHVRLGTVVRCTDGLDYMVYSTGDFLNSNAALNIDTAGVVVGSGSTPPTISDSALGMKIVHGTGSGQLQYGAVAFGAPASDSTTSQFTVTRNFANASGSSVTVNEIGLYVTQYSHVQYPAHGQYPFTVVCMVLRDVIGGGIAVPNGQTLTVNYRPQAVS
jgi:hypothetical protein